MASGLLTIKIELPASGANDISTVARGIAKALLVQASQQIGAGSSTSGELIHNEGKGNQVIGTWQLVLPA
jgi:hypothetical protein